MKKAEEKGFPRGLVTELCRQLAQEENIDEGTLKAKVGNYKSLAGYTKITNASSATRHFFNKYGDLSAVSIEAIIRDMKNETKV
ncbi:MAG TPA: hypothetical protein PLU46_08920 [Thiotrichales bacterium]|nr:hypothetical protein [Thiotrichales bacterium]